VSGFLIVRASDHRVMRWRNGGGETAEIAVSSLGAGLDAFDWRLSMARVEADGPFSSFPGIDRTLAILDGEGIRLSVGVDQPVTLTRASEPHAFPADVPAAADLVRGPVVDLNVMSRRGHASHSVTRLRLADQTQIAPAGETALVFCAEGAVAVEADGKLIELSVRDSLIWSEGPLNAVLRPQPSALVYVVTIGRS